MITMNSPDLTTTAFYMDMQRQSHLLIGGTTGSGKSNLLNGFIHSLLMHFPDEHQLILIDPKYTALKKFRSLPHTLTYACETDEMQNAVKYAYEVMKDRFQGLNSDDFLEEYNGSHIWILIDEYFEFTNKVNGATIKALESIASLGRASRIHIVFCTQRPTSDIITGMVKSNVTATIALKTATPQESRNLIDVRGCEDLKMHIEAYYRTSTYAGELAKIDIPYADPEELKRVITHWTSQLNQ